MSKRKDETLAEYRARQRLHVRAYQLKYRRAGWPSIEVEREFVDAIRELLGLDPLLEETRCRLPT